MAQGGGGAAAALGILGGVFGGLGNFFQSRGQKKAFRRFRRRQQLALAETRTFADKRVAELTAKDTLIGKGISFLQGTFDDPQGSPLATSLRKSIQVAQESRGLRRSTIGAVAEARALGAFSQKLRASLLPEVARFGTIKENLRQGIISFEAPLRIGAATGLNITGLQAAPGLQSGFASGGSTAGILQGVASGFLGGAQIGLAQDNAIKNQQFNQDLLEELRAERLRNSLQSSRAS